ncbi:glycosyltransferase [Candidatus Woesearchaeota archaeon]|jgi:glycosyltransferase involved in cell wall biosynthesis|nr:glycosyltransferase [Candidatus Woesearchaeota archaeon]MBT6045173.1 glycosyltransferase [Candidatus Woesearchaeota archaeon]
MITNGDLDLGFEVIVMSKNPKISVVTPAHNEEEDIHKALDSVLSSGYSNLEFIISNDGSIDGTVEVVKSYMKKNKNIKLVDHPTGTSAAAARNRGAKKATGEILVFLDADTGISDGFLQSIAKNFEDKRIDSVGHMKENTFSNLLSRLVALLGRPSKEVREIKDGQIIKNYIGYNPFVISRKAFLDLKGFDEKIFYYEDEDLGKRFFSKGYKGVWNSKILFYSEQPADLKGVYRQCLWSGKGIASMKDKERQKNEIKYSAAKLAFMFGPFGLLFFNIYLGAFFILAAYALTYFYALRASKSVFYSFLMVPVMYLRNLFEFYGIMRYLIKK